MSYHIEFWSDYDAEWQSLVGDGDASMPGYVEYATAAEAKAALEERANRTGFGTSRYRVIGEPDAPSPATILTTDKKARKAQPMARGLLDYFPRALAAVSNVSFVANEQHNPGEPMHWARGKSTDHADCIIRHLVERGTVDAEDGLRHAAKLAWRALALLETELELAEGIDAEAAAKGA